MSLLRRNRRGNRANVNIGTKPAPSERTTGNLAQDWREIRADSDIQFAEVPMPEAKPETAPPSDWLGDFLQWLAEAFAPVGEGLATGWPVFKWVLLGLGIALVTLIIWRVLKAGWSSRLGKAQPAAEWQPNQQEALALLEEADRLAAEGRYDEATHLLLQRSVGQIAQARPDLVEPSSTAREIAVQPSLPDGARKAFAVIAERVERSLFALKRLSADDWQVARSAYADFALAQKTLAQTALRA